MAISFSGLASGLDTNSWVTALTQLRQAKVTTLQEKKQVITEQFEALSGIKSFFTSFRSLVSKVTDTRFNAFTSADIFSQNLVTSSKPSIVTATATGEAKEASYKIKVDQLATNTVAQSGYKYNTTYTETTKATYDTYLKNLGAKAGNIDVTVGDITRRINITDNDTISTFAQKLRDIGVTAGFDITTGKFSMNIGASAINEVDEANKTNIVDALKLSDINYGYTHTTALSTTEQVVTEIIADKDTLLSDLGVNTGTFQMEYDGGGIEVVIDGLDTLGSLMEALSGAGIKTTLENGVFTIHNAEITDAGDTDIINALGLNDAVQVSSKILTSDYLKLETTITSATDALITTKINDILDSGEFLLENDTVRLRVDSTGMEHTITFTSADATIEDFVVELNNIEGVTATFNESRLQISGAEIIGGTFNAEEAFGLGKSQDDTRTYSLTSGNSLYAMEVNKAKLTSTLESLGYTGEQTLILKNSKGDITTIEYQDTMTLAEVQASLSQFGITMTLNDGVLGLSNTMTPENETFAITGGTLAEAWGIEYTEEITELYSQESAALNCITTVTATATSTLAELGITEQNPSIKVYNSDNSFHTEIAFSTADTLQTVIDNLNTILGEGTVTLTDGVLKVESTDGKYITGSLPNALGIGVISAGGSVTTTGTSITSSEPVTFTRSEFALKDNSLYEIGLTNETYTLNIKNQEGEVIKTFEFVNPQEDKEYTEGYIKIQDTSIEELFDILKFNGGIDAILVDGKVSLNSTNGNYIDGTLADALGIGTTVNTTVTTVRNDMTSSSPITVTAIVRAAEWTDTIADYINADSWNFTIHNDVTDVHLSTFITSTTTFTDLKNILNQNGINMQMANGRVTLTGTQGHIYADGSLIDAFGIEVTETAGNTTIYQSDDNISEKINLVTTEQVTTTLSNATKLSELGLSGDQTFTITDSSGSTYTKTFADTTDLGTIRTELSNSYGINMIVKSDHLEFQNNLKNGKTYAITGGTLADAWDIGSITDIEKTLKVTSTEAITCSTVYTLKDAVDDNLTIAQFADKFGLTLPGSIIASVYADYIIRDDGEASHTVFASTTSLSTILNWYESKGIDYSFQDNGTRIVFTSTDGRVAAGTLIDLLGATPEAVSGMVTTTTDPTRTSTAAITYTTSGYATENNTLAEALGLSGIKVLVIEDNLGNVAFQTTLDNTTTTLGGLFDILDNYGINCTINSENGSIIVDTTDSIYHIQNGRVYAHALSQSLSTVTGTVTATMSSTISDFVTAPLSFTVYTPENSSGTEITLEADATFQEFADAIDDYGLAATLVDTATGPVMKITDNSGSAGGCYVEGDLINAFGITTTANGTGTAYEATTTTLVSGVAFVTTTPAGATTVSAATTFGDINGIDFGTQRVLYINKYNSLQNNYTQETLTVLSTMSIGSLINTLGEHDIDVELNNGSIIFIENKSGFYNYISGELANTLGIGTGPGLQITSTVTTPQTRTSTAAVTYISETMTTLTPGTSERGATGAVGGATAATTTVTATSTTTLGDLFGDELTNLEIVLGGTNARTLTIASTQTIAGMVNVLNGVGVTATWTDYTEGPTMRGTGLSVGDASDTTWIEDVNLNGSIIGGTVTSFESVFNLSGSAYYTTAETRQAVYTNTASDVLNTTSGSGSTSTLTESQMGSLVVAQVMPMFGSSPSSGSITVADQYGNGDVINISVSTRMSKLLNDLKRYGIENSYDESTGKLTLTQGDPDGDGKEAIIVQDTSGLLGALGINFADSYSTSQYNKYAMNQGTESLSVVTESITVAHMSGQVETVTETNTANGSTTFSILDPNTVGKYVTVMNGPSEATFTVTSDSNIDDFLTFLTSNGFSTAQINGTTGIITTKANSGVYIKPMDPVIASALKLDMGVAYDIVTSEGNTGTFTNTSSNTFSTGGSGTIVESTLLKDIVGFSDTTVNVMLDGSFVGGIQLNGDMNVAAALTALKNSGYVKEAELNNGKISITYTDNVVLNGLPSSFKLGTASTLGSTTTLSNTTSKNLVATTTQDVNVLLSDDNLGNVILDDLYVGSGTIHIYNKTSTSAGTIAYNSSTSLSELLNNLSNYGISYRISGGQIVFDYEEGGNFIGKDTSSSTSFLASIGITSPSKTATVGHHAMANGTVKMEASNSSELEESTVLSQIGITTVGTLKVKTATGYANINYFQNTSIAQLIEEFSDYGIEAYVTSDGRFKIKQTDVNYIMEDTLGDEGLLKKLNLDLSTSFTEVTENTTVNSAGTTAFYADRTHTMDYSTTFGDLGITIAPAGGETEPVEPEPAADPVEPGVVKIMYNGAEVKFSVNSSTTVNEFMSWFENHGFTTSLSNGRLTITGSDNAYIVNDLDNEIDAALNFADVNGDALYTTTTLLAGDNTDSKVLTVNEIQTITKDTTLGTLVGYESGQQITISQNGETKGYIYLTKDKSIEDILNSFNSAGINAEFEEGKIKLEYLDDYSISGLPAYLDFGIASATEDSKKMHVVDPQRELSADSVIIATTNATLGEIFLDGEIGYTGGSYNLQAIVDGQSTIISLSKDDTIDVLFDKLSSKAGIHGYLNDDGKIVLSSDKSFSFSGNIADFLFGDEKESIQEGTLNTGYKGDDLQTLKYDTATVNASDTTALSDLGVTSGFIYVHDDTGRHKVNINADETLGDFRQILEGYGLKTSYITTEHGRQLIIEGEGNSYIEALAANDETRSNIIEELFSTNAIDTSYNYQTSLSYTVTNDVTHFATADTLLSVFDTYDGDGNLTASSAGSLIVNVGDVPSTIEITADDTIGSFLGKLEQLGINAQIDENGIITLDGGDNSFSIDTENSTSKVVANLGLEGFNGYYSSTEELKYDEEITEEIALSAANYADTNTKLSTLNITAGSFNVFVNGAKKTINVTADTTFSDLANLIGNGAKVEFDADGYMKIYSETEGTKISIGSTTDTSNFASICGLVQNEDGSVSSSRALYKVNADSKLTSSGLFRRGTVSAGSFIVGDDSFEITADTTIKDLVNQINYSTKANASAYWDSVEGRLVITARDGGASYINIGGDSNLAEILGYTDNSGRLLENSQIIGQNAKFTINGTEFTSTSNTVTSDVSRIEGVTINLKNISTSEEDPEITLTVERDTEKISETFSEIVDSYNTLMEKVNEEIAGTGTLSDQSMLKMLKNSIRSLMTNAITTTGQYKSLAAIGITVSAAASGNIATNNIDTLSFNKEDFIKAFKEDPNAVRTLLIGDSEVADDKGVFGKLDDLLYKNTEISSGYFATQEKSYREQIRRMDDRIRRTQSSVDRYKARLEKKFQTMDLLISNAQNQYSSFLGGGTGIGF